MVSCGELRILEAEEKVMPQTYEWWVKNGQHAMLSPRNRELLLHRLAGKTRAELVVHYGLTRTRVGFIENRAKLYWQQCGQYSDEDIQQQILACTDLSDIPLERLNVSQRLLNAFTNSYLPDRPAYEAKPSLLGLFSITEKECLEIPAVSYVTWNEICWVKDKWRPFIPKHLLNKLGC
jgi:hypothetical protein